MLVCHYLCCSVVDVFDLVFVVFSLLIPPPCLSLRRRNRGAIRSISTLRMVEHMTSYGYSYGPFRDNDRLIPYSPASRVSMSLSALG